MNVFLCDKVMSAAYLAKYAAGEEERAMVKVSTESEVTVNVAVKSMKNIKIASQKWKTA